MLYLVATPIGNLDDITIRALKILNLVDIIACEDTRNTLKVLNHYEIKNKKLISYHKYNENKISEKIIKLLNNGTNIALVSDAGMPCISDPGYILVKKCKENGINVVPIPGANAALTALVGSGIESYNFTFFGFLSRKKTDRNIMINKILKNNLTSIIYESPHRIKNLIEEIEKIDSKRLISVGRELTKIHEEIITDTVSNIKNLISDSILKQKGEFVLIISPHRIQKEEIPNELIIKEIDILVKEGYKTSYAIKEVSAKYDLAKRKIYEIYHKQL